VTVKFDSGKKLQVNGELIAQGTAGNLITFTSNQASPAPGDWGNIEFTGTAITTTMDAEGNYVSAAMKNTQFFAQNLLRTGLFLGLDGPRCLV